MGEGLIYSLLIEKLKRWKLAFSGEPFGSILAALLDDMQEWVGILEKLKKEQDKR